VLRLPLVLLALLVGWEGSLSGDRKVKQLMPPNAQDAHGSTGLPVTAAPAAAANKMDCFLTTACTPLNLQVGIDLLPPVPPPPPPPRRTTATTAALCYLLSSKCFARAATN
jgi:hypothetical protein